MFAKPKVVETVTRRFEKEGTWFRAYASQMDEGPWSFFIEPRHRRGALRGQGVRHVQELIHMLNEIKELMEEE
jgi:hypothetical protein